MSFCLGTLSSKEPLSHLPSFLTKQVKYIYGVPRADLWNSKRLSLILKSFQLTCCTAIIKATCKITALASYHKVENRFYSCSVINSEDFPATTTLLIVQTFDGQVHSYIELQSKVEKAVFLQHSATS